MALSTESSLGCTSVVLMAIFDQLAILASVQSSQVRGQASEKRVSKTVEHAGEHLRQFQGAQILFTCRPLLGVAASRERGKNLALFRLARIHIAGFEHRTDARRERNHSPCCFGFAVGDQQRATPPVLEMDIFPAQRVELRRSQPAVGQYSCYRLQRLGRGQQISRCLPRNGRFECD